ncbi:MAG: Dynamin family protein [Deltaproteobacteria bacterium RBG_13_49_15]|nr:MAG: Dynamin family protein [Deltaproteobacteria bacterium RBG_13_49_15]
MVKEHLSPVALRYGYSEAPLETNIKWRPLVLVIGNYSSGKSALINEFLGADIQATGQAPTDDSFTVITYDDKSSPETEIRTTEERDGKYLLNDPEFPFESLKKHGQRFAAHFRLKRVSSPFLKSLAVIDTPGMLDSIAEKDRGYNYQEVIGDFAHIADLILVLFDPHKAGTVREAHISLRDILPARTFEDRVLFVLNRIDECGSLTDLLRVYGTLCWNLSQITGRKDIPMIHLTYSSRVARLSRERLEHESDYLKHLENQREDLRKAILEAPRYRLDNMAAFVETQSERLSHFLEALSTYRRKVRNLTFSHLSAGLLFSIIAAAAGTFFLSAEGALSGISSSVQIGLAGGASALLFLLWMAWIMKLLRRRFLRKQLKNIDGLTPLDSQRRQDSWEGVRDLVNKYLQKTGGKFSTRGVNKDFEIVKSVFEKGSKEVREALNELASIRPETPISEPPGPFLASLSMEKGR